LCRRKASGVHAAHGGPLRYFQGNPVATAEALRLFNSAIELDPDFARAYSHASSSKMLLGMIPAVPTMCREKVDDMRGTVPFDIASLEGSAFAVFLMSLPKQAPRRKT